MAAEHIGDSPEFHEKLPTDRLVAYLHGQFMDAVQKETSEGFRDEANINGAFIQRVPLDSGHALLRGSRRIVLKPPHPVDLPGFHCVVYAVRLNEESKALSDSEYLDDVDFYVLRDYTNGRPGPYWLINEDGAGTAEVDDVVPFNVADFPDLNVMEYIDIAGNMLEKYSGYNIVASAE